MLLWIAVHAVLGLIIGSFLNVVVLRKNTGKSLAGRSGCLSCGQSLRTQHLLPVVSWVFLRGRCAYCGSAISVQYPLVEIGTALLFSLVALMYLPLISHIGALVLMSYWVCIATYDIRHTIIPDDWVYGAACAAFLTTVALFPAALSSVWFWVAGPITAVPLYLLWFFSKGRAMGFGDVKLALSMGWLLGPWFGLLSVMWGFMLGALYAVLCIMVPIAVRELYTTQKISGLRRILRTRTMKHEVPFGPFLIGGTLLVWITLALHLPFPLLLFV